MEPPVSESPASHAHRTGGTKRPETREATHASATEKAVDQARIEVIRDTQRIRAMLLDLIGKASEEVLFLFPTPNAFHREESIGAIAALVTVASRGAGVSILTPADSIIEKTIRTLNAENESRFDRPISFRRISQAKTRDTVTIVVVDRKSSLVIEQREDSQLDFNLAVGVATYSTSNSTVLAAVRFFERLWEEVEMRGREELLLEKERQSRRAAELLQDVLSHDMRNYNQIAKLNAEVLREVPGMPEEERRQLLDELVRAIDQSTELIDTAKKLGKIMSQQNVMLEPKDLGASFERSLSVVRAANRNKSIRVTTPFEDGNPGEGTLVMADNLLDEVITNVLTNSVKYTDGPEVDIRVELCPEERLLEAAPRSTHGWKLSIADSGRGIPDEMKEGLFSRYLETAKGSGLGLSIVRALVVERYMGWVGVRDRVDGDYSRGTVVEAWIPSVPPTRSGLTFSPAT